MLASFNSPGGAAGRVGELILTAKVLHYLVGSGNDHIREISYLGDNKRPRRCMRRTSRPPAPCVTHWIGCASEGDEGVVSGAVSKRRGVLTCSPHAADHTHTANGRAALSEYQLLYSFPCTSGLEMFKCRLARRTYVNRSAFALFLPCPPLAQAGSCCVCEYRSWEQLRGRRGCGGGGGQAPAGRP